MRNAKISHTTLGYQHHGIFTCSLQLDYGGCVQSFGGYALDESEGVNRVGTAYGMQYIIEILKVLGIESWEEVVGQNIRVKTEKGCVTKIGHFLEDRWFDPAELGSRYRQKGHV